VHPARAFEGRGRTLARRPARAKKGRQSRTPRAKTVARSAAQRLCCGTRRRAPPLRTRSPAGTPPPRAAPDQRLTGAGTSLAGRPAGRPAEARAGSCPEGEDGHEGGAHDHGRLPAAAAAAATTRTGAMSQATLPARHRLRECPRRRPRKTPRRNTPNPVKYPANIPRHPARAAGLVDGFDCRRPTVMAAYRRRRRRGARWGLYDRDSIR
jgi:hypothetical protein